MNSAIYFGSPVQVTPALVPATDISIVPAPGDSAVAILFRNFELELDIENSDLSGVSTVALRLPTLVSGDSGLIGYLADLRGTVCKDADARAVIMVDLGARAHTIEFPYDEPIDAPYDRDLFSMERHSPVQYDWDTRPVPPCMVTIVISVQRRTSTSRIRFALDFIGVSIATTVPSGESARTRRKRRRGKAADTDRSMAAGAQDTLY